MGAIKMTDDEYNGWTNRETWAVRLHWDNNQDDYDFIMSEAKKHIERGEPVYRFADFLKEIAEDIQDTVINEKSATHEARLFIQDVGSLWRVNWLEIAERYYDEIAEEEGV